MTFGRPKKDRPSLDQAGLMEYAGKSLGSRMRSERDLRRLLLGRAASGDEGADAVDAVLARLKELGYLNDERFAADFTRLRQENEKFGRRRVQQGLMQKGVAAATVQQALGAAYDEVDEVQLARQFADRKRMKRPEGEKETARAVRRLVAAGFSTKAVWALLRGWGSELQEADLEAADGE